MRVPGTSAGLLPERADRDAGDWLAAWLARVRAGRARRQLLGVVAAIDGEAKRLDLRDDEAIDREIANLRRDLTIGGLRGGAMARAFALLRELADATLGQRPYDVQLLGGWVMARGMLAEMNTGEGKTLAAALPAACAALAGMPVHLISCNDYLVERDAEAMRPLFERLGLSVGCVTGAHPDQAHRRRAYGCDITYVTAHQLAFDYLRDHVGCGHRRALHKHIDRLDDPEGERLLRGLAFAIVDEADSVLVDAARTPFVLSRPVAAPGREALVRAALGLATPLEQGRDFDAISCTMQCALTETGRQRIEAALRRWPDQGAREGLAQRQLREQWLERALAVLHLYERETHYIVREERVEIVDRPTGRRMPGHAWEHGIHQLVEAKEGCPLTPRVEPVARISGQRLFSRYLHLSGMTATGRAVRDEFARVYHLDCVAIPTRRAVRRSELPLRVFANPQQHWSYVIDRLAALRDEGRPVLVGTRSIEESESLSSALTAWGLSHRVLNASQDREEADIVAQAGRAGRITVATNMAGRGTDIALGPGVEALGGLHVLSIELGESSRYDAQLRGRCARQGDPGSFEQILCLRDRGVLARLPDWLCALAARWSRCDETGACVIPITLGKTLVWLAQRTEETRSARARRDLVRQQREWDAVLAFAGTQE